MYSAAFAKNVWNGNTPDQEENVLKSIWSEYERVIIESLISSFGLDFLVTDRHGGDVDTIHNVRNMKNDSELTYKNKNNEMQYANRGNYNTSEYHTDDRFKDMKKQAKQKFNEKGVWLRDAYTGVKIAPNKGASREKQAQLDHVIAAKDIHDDAGRVLAGLSGVDLANNPDNLRFTNACLNNNMRDKPIPEYIKWCEENPDKVNWNGKKGEPLPDDVKKQLLDEYDRAKREYDKKINKAYYTSPQFAKDMTSAAGKLGAQMGIRQAFGFILAEIWFAVKDEIQNISGGCSLESILYAIGDGIKDGINNTRIKYKDLISKMEEGFMAGVLSSLTTTLCNIFFTTAKTLIKKIRQIYASVVQAGKILLFNPDNLQFGERIKSASVIIVTGASILVGMSVTEAIENIPFIKNSDIGDGIATFGGTLVSGILSCTLLMFLDRSAFMQKIVNRLNEIPTEVSKFKEIANYMEELAAEYAKLDIEKFKKDTMVYETVSKNILNTNDEKELNGILKGAYQELGLDIPWKGDFDEFMSNKSNRLVFS